MLEFKLGCYTRSFAFAYTLHVWSFVIFCSRRKQLSYANRMSSSTCCWLLSWKADLENGCLHCQNSIFDIGLQKQSRDKHWRILLRTGSAPILLRYLSVLGLCSLMDRLVMMGCGVGILLVSPRGATYAFSIRMTAPCTNNLVEYEAVRKGMELLLEAGAEAVEIFGDSKLVISQLTEEYRCESETLFPIWMQCRELMSQFRYINFH